NSVGGIERSRRNHGSLAAFAGDKANEYVNDHAAVRIVEPLHKVSGRLRPVPAVETDAGLARYFDDTSKAVYGHARGDFNLLVRSDRPFVLHFETRGRAASFQISERTRQTPSMVRLLIIEIVHT